jgi:hypothetical protein
MERVVVINKIVLSNLVRFKLKVAKGLFGPSSSANSRTYNKGAMRV